MAGPFCVSCARHVDLNRIETIKSTASSLLIDHASDPFWPWDRPIFGWKRRPSTYRPTTRLRWTSQTSATDQASKRYRPLRAPTQLEPVMTKSGVESCRTQEGNERKQVPIERHPARTILPLRAMEKHDMHCGIGENID